MCPAQERGTVKVCDDGKMRCPWFLCCLDHERSQVRARGLTSFGCVSAPRLRVVHQKNEVLLQLEESDARQEDIMCQMLWNETPGDLLLWVSHCNVLWF